MIFYFVRGESWEIPRKREENVSAEKGKDTWWGLIGGGRLGVVVGFGAVTLSQKPKNFDLKRRGGESQSKSGGMVFVWCCLVWRLSLFLYFS